MFNRTPDATLKTSDEKIIEISRNLSKESSPKRHDEQFHTVEESTISRVSDSSTFDSRTSHAGSGNNQGLKRTTQRATEAADKASLKSSLNEGSKGWPFEHPSRPKDFKSREDRFVETIQLRICTEHSIIAVLLSIPTPVALPPCHKSLYLKRCNLTMWGGPSWQTTDSRPNANGLGEVAPGGSDEKRTSCGHGLA